MRVLIDINHPADVHQFKNMIWQMEKRGHKFLITARDKDCALDLLKEYKFDFIKRPGYKGLMKLIGVFLIDYRLYRIAKKFNPDILVGSSGDCYIAQVSKILRKPSIVFDDTEHSSIQNWLTFPFADKIVTPESYKINLGKKQVRYNGFKELAYLHPKYFKPDTSILEELGLKKNDKFILIRFVSWEAAHDIGKTGIKDKIDFVESLAKKYKVFVSSEAPLPKELEKYEIMIKKEKIHSVLWYSSLYIGEGATMATEAALLGIPTIYINELQLGYINKLKKAKLIICAKNELEAYKASEKIMVNNLKKNWQMRKNSFLSNYDVTSFMVSQLEAFK
ncbi:MAG: DUF354 domain-containing protein [Nanoarchaeota archaeon]|nr:DUF354 domain-containing protein [Nanoarchaeota archaeon]